MNFLNQKKILNFHQGRSRKPSPPSTCTPPHLLRVPPSHRSKSKPLFYNTYTSASINRLSFSLSCIEATYIITDPVPLSSRVYQKLDRTSAHLLPSALLPPLAHIYTRAERIFPPLHNPKRERERNALFYPIPMHVCELELAAGETCFLCVLYIRIKVRYNTER